MAANAEGPWPWGSGLLALLCLGLGLAPEALQALLEYRPEALQRGELWRLAGAHFAHYSPGHAAANAVVLLAAGGHIEPRLGARRLLALALVCALAISLALWLGVPEMARYRGASGVATMFLVLALLELRRGSGAMIRAFAAGLLALVAGAVLAHALGFAGLPGSLPPGVRSAWQAHVLGAALALLPWIAGRCPAQQRNPT